MFGSLRLSTDSFLFLQNAFLRFVYFFFFFSSRRRHTRFKCDWSSDVFFRSIPSWGSMLRPVQHAPQTGDRAVTQAEKFERGPGKYNINGGTHKACYHQPDLIGKNLKEDDAPGVLSTRTCRHDKLAVAHRQRLRAQHARLPRPVRNHNHQGARHWAAWEVGCKHYRQGDRGKYKRDIGQQSQQIVYPAAKVATNQAD